MFAIGLFENGSAVARNHGRQNENVTSEAHNAAARELATAGTVLLQNRRGMLPLDPTAISSVAVIGGAAAHETGDGAPNNPGTGLCDTFRSDCSKALVVSKCKRIPGSDYFDRSVALVEPTTDHAPNPWRCVSWQASRCRGRSRAAAAAAPSCPRTEFPSSKPSVPEWPRRGTRQARSAF